MVIPALFSCSCTSETVRWDIGFPTGILRSNIKQDWRPFLSLIRVEDPISTPKMRPHFGYPGKVRFRHGHPPPRFSQRQDHGTEAEICRRGLSQRGRCDGGEVLRSARREGEV